MFSRNKNNLSFKAIHKVFDMCDYKPKGLKIKIHNRIPIPTGYGGKGKSALMAMLQFCSPGQVVVNIDNGFGAGCAAVLIAKQRNE